VTLSGSRPGIATVPASVTVPFGESSATFSVSTQRSGLDRDVVVSAQYDGLVRTGTLHLREMAEARSPRDTATEGAPSHTPHRAGPRAVPRNTVFAPKRASIRVSAPSRLDPETQTETPERRFYFYTPELNLLAETELTADATPDIEYEYVWFGGQPIAQIATATDTISWYFNDHLGTPVLQTDAAAEVVWRVEREPFGKIFDVRAGAEFHQPLAFPGQEEDGGDTAYNIHRWYRAGWGRYTQSDPLADDTLRRLTDSFDDHANPYRYAMNNPLIIIDSGGKAATVMAGAAIGSAAGPVGTVLGAIAGALIGVAIIYIWGDDLVDALRPVEMAKGGKSEINHIAGDALAAAGRRGDPCAILEEWLQQAKCGTDTTYSVAEIVQAQKQLGCRNKQKRQSHY
jgi:RHS repeat-associated protein